MKRFKFQIPVNQAKKQINIMKNDSVKEIKISNPCK